MIVVVRFWIDPAKSDQEILDAILGIDGDNGSSDK